jgi:2-dehydropantoate 2-reductase
MNRKIAVLGAGAIGSSIAADLAKAKLDVTVVDQWPAHVEAIKAKGLRIVMPDEDLQIAVPACHLCELASAHIEFDIVFLAAKSGDTRWMTELIKPYLAGNGVLVGMQNSMNDDAIASIVGRERTMGCVVELSGEIFTPGLVQRNTTRAGTWFAVGELDGALTARAKEIQAILQHVAKVDLPGNIYGAKWTKLIVNSMAMGPNSVLGLRSWESVQLPGMLDFALKLAMESFTVGRALGYRIEPIFGLRADEFAGSPEEVLAKAASTLRKATGTKSRTAAIQDHLKGRRSEIEYINGLVARKGREVNVPTPYNDAVVELDRQINQGLLKMDASNFERLLQQVGGAPAA